MSYEEQLPRHPCIRPGPGRQNVLHDRLLISFEPKEGARLGMPPARTDWFQVCIIPVHSLIGQIRLIGFEYVGLKTLPGSLKSAEALATVGSFPRLWKTLEDPAQTGPNLSAAVPSGRLQTDSTSSFRERCSDN